VVGFWSKKVGAPGQVFDRLVLRDQSKSTGPFRPRKLASLSGIAPTGYVVLAVLMTVTLFATSFDDSGLAIPLVWQLVGSLLGGSIMILAYRNPTESLLLCAVACALVGWFVPAFYSLQLELVLLLFIVAWRTSLPLAVTSGVGLVSATALYLGKSTNYPAITITDIIVTPILLTGLSVGAGAQTRRLRVANEQLLKLAAVDRRNAVVEERRRIARELHDVAAHHLSAVVVKSKIALRLDTAQDLRDANTFAAGSASDALASMRQLVGVLSDLVSMS
jgi:signal transduction histidine kinase